MARRKKSPSQVKKTRQLESLEARQVMSANPLLGGPALVQHAIVEEAPALTQHAQAPEFDFRFDPEVLLGEQNTLDGRIEQTLNDAHALTGLDDVSARYGFDGSGQTVAVIDSGIAYRHFALGGGLGADYRVVGGYDFTENDADPYDDGPAGSHGTHVAGIVGASGGAHEGVAPGVDLVGLRVFDDAGNGFFHWVEQALQWVHDNRNAFENPITAVNLSLGTEFNGSGIPGWAMLEEEFAQLEADGIFISVSAGNSYQNFLQNGLSYPAASPHVIPVLATNNDGSLAFFSQRHARGIAAPGRFITSTVPDYAGNDANSVDDDYLSFSGTSQAAPYVAGASVLIREAFEFVGRTNLDQWEIYDHIVSTADVFFDSASQTSYNRLNIERAIDAILPEDDFGSSIATAHNIGVVNESSGLGTQSVISGVVTTLDDADYFSFTAGATGTVTVEATNVTHALDVQWGGGWTLNADGSYSIEVVAGQTYTFGLSSADGLGYYDLSLNLDQVVADQPASAFAAAFQLDQQHGFFSNGNQFENYGGRGEKWFQAADKSWHFITPDGSISAWDGGVGANGSVIATLSATHHQNLELVLEAPDASSANATLLASIDSGLGLTDTANSVTSGGVQWLRAESGDWYFLTAEGGLFEWQAGTSLNDSVLLVELDASIYNSPELLTNASASNSVEQIAFDLDQQLGLEFTGNYFENFAGQGERWLRSASNSRWYYITPSGEVHQFVNLANPDANPLVATLTSSYFADPSLLFDAAAPQSATVTAVASSQANAASLAIGAQHFGETGLEALGYSLGVNREGDSIRSAQNGAQISALSSNNALSVEETGEAFANGWSDLQTEEAQPLTGSEGIPLEASEHNAAVDAALASEWGVDLSVL